MIEVYQVYPTQFYALEGEKMIFKVEAFNCCAASVKIESLVTVELWDEISPQIRECLVQMKLGDA